MNQDKIVIKGAREHNLKNISLEIPKNKLVVITGVSGSGKSTLAFDTIYSEGQRKYVESLSAYARQFLQMMNKPDVDAIEGLSPAISIEQKTTQKNPRSTVGTVTEIYDYLRVLFARIGIPYSPATGLPIKSQSVSEITDNILNNNLGKKIYILSPIVRDRKGEYKKEIEEIKRKGYQRLRIDKIIYEIDETPNLKKNFKHNIEVLIDRLNVKENIQFGLKVRKVPAEEREKKVAEAAQGVGLTELLDRKPANLSGGQRQRVALARSIVSDQSVCLMDEPLSNLDSKLRAEMRDEIRDLQKRLGLTVVYVTHDQVEAMSMADQIILLKLGEIVQVGAPEEIYNSPNSVFSAQFIGLPPMNILNINEIDISSLDSKIYSEVDSNKNIKDIGVRPEHIVFSKKGLPVVVKSIDYFGGETVFKLTHQEKDFFLREPRQPKIQLGDQLNVSWNLDDMYLFDKNDQRLKS
mgnify:CR=1 FL=1